MSTPEEEKSYYMSQDKEDSGDVAGAIFFGCIMAIIVGSIVGYFFQ